MKSSLFASAAIFAWHGMACADTFDDLYTANALCSLRIVSAMDEPYHYQPGFENCTRVAAAFNAYQADQRVRTISAADAQAKEALSKALADISATDSCRGR